MLRSSDRRAGVLAALFLAAPSVAQWQPVEVAQTPPPRTGFLLLPLSNGELLLFGGDVGNPNASEWVFDGANWRPTAVGIPRRSDAAGAVSGSRSLIHGGRNGAQLLNDTWFFTTTGQWIPYPSLVQPGPLSNLSMAADPASERVVMIGQNAGGVFETWFATVVTPISGWSAGPTFTAPQAALVEDRVRGCVELFLTGLPGFEVRRLVGNQWVTSAVATTGPTIGEIAFEPNRGRTVVLEAFDNRATDEWDGLRFVVDQPRSGAFVASTRTAMAFHPGRDELVLVTNYTGTIETWRYVVAPTPAAFAFGAGCGTGQLTIGLQAGDLPQPGSSHRLRIDANATTNNSWLTVAVIGLSTAQNGGLPLPQPLPLASSTCLLRVEALLVDLLGVGVPQTRLVTLPPSPALLGLRYAAQALQLDAAGIRAASHGLQVQVGLPRPENVLLESFATAQNRDPIASGDPWANGSATPAAIGGDGRHGSFDPAFGQDLGNGVYLWNTDNTVIPGTATIDGAPALITDGRYFFTDFVVPAGITVRFVGSVPPVISVRGQVTVTGTVSCDAEGLPFFVPTSGAAAGQQVSTFVARSPVLTAPLPGQVGGAGGPGGGRGGNGGAKCLGAGPIVANGVILTDGQPGADVRLPAGHAYAGSAVGTGGPGSPMIPAAGTVAAAGLVGGPLIQSIFRSLFSVGGSGGGYLLPGALPTIPSIAAVGATQPTASPAPAASVAFPLLPLPVPAPSGYSSLHHFLVGGSGGGGGGCHVFSTLNVVTTDVFVAGSAGSGGGGALALRAGGDLTVFGELSARGGAGVLINGDNPNTPAQEFTLGISSPGGGGSGGSLLLQSAGRVSVRPGASLTTAGGAGSRTGSISSPFLNVVQQAGGGSSGFYRLESPVLTQFQGTGVPAFTQNASGALLDRDARTGSRSTWLLPSSPALPVYLRYELLVDIGGNSVLFSDDPNVSTLRADDPNGPVLLRFQGGRFDPLTGQVLAATVGPWRTTLAPGPQSVNRDLATTLRFDLVVDKGLGVTAVRELRIVWR